ncbi:uncharacterized protein B0H18DRAFT_126054 [Fomitopsis serialis]|uniref:uncharacterized protein n=1 Tax=Fomitopsis serialis TaxID=139415 RepID=UPI002008767A|nr:uncharacterized protein B0H18DRAFT_126054 [Neoantrodia serialis]KAH9914459.1 hypothetical protein B0H18DRAFT_126054 [Neoantrodia serialis]
MSTNRNRPVYPHSEREVCEAAGVHGLADQRNMPEMVWMSGACRVSRTGAGEEKEILKVRVGSENHGREKTRAASPAQGRAGVVDVSLASGVHTGHLRHPPRDSVRCDVTVTSRSAKPSMLSAHVPPHRPPGLPAACPSLLRPARTSHPATGHTSTPLSASTHPRPYRVVDGWVSLCLSQCGPGQSGLGLEPRTSFIRCQTGESG